MGRVTVGVRAASRVCFFVVCVRRDFAWFALIQRFDWKMARVVRAI